MSYQQFAYVYDALMDDMPYEKWLEFAELNWSEHAQPKFVVDLGCGTGNITIPLAERYERVIGIDLSEDMLSVARDKLERRNFQHKVMLLQQDLRDWSLTEPADAIISFCDCFNYILEQSELIEAFQQVYNNLKVGGSFIFDVHTKLRLQSYAEEEPFSWKDEDMAYVWNCHLDQERMELEHDLSIFIKNTDGRQYRRINEIHLQRAYDLDWIATELARIGFNNVKCLADFTMEEATDQTMRAFFVAKKI